MVADVLSFLVVAVTVSGRQNQYCRATYCRIDNFERDHTQEWGNLITGRHLHLMDMAEMLLAKVFKVLTSGIKAMQSDDISMRGNIRYLCNSRWYICPLFKCDSLFQSIRGAFHYFMTMDSDRTAWKATLTLQYDR